MKYTFPVLLAAMAGTLAGASQPPLSLPDASVWTGGAYLHEFRAGCCLDKDGGLRGVMRIKVPTGKENVYHYTGIWQTESARFQAAHHSGHRARGRLLDGDTAEFTVTTRDGRSLTVHARRMAGAVPDDDCGPPPWTR